MMKAGIIDEMISDAMESAMGDADLEEDVEAEVDKVRAGVEGCGGCGRFAFLDGCGKV